MRGRFRGIRFVVNMEHSTGRLHAMTATVPERRRWAALYVLCLGVLMIVLDTTIVNVALPSIRADLGFTEASLSWVVNAYMLTFGGFLLLGGRLGDLYGHRKLFLVGITLFTLASLACGLAKSQALLVARARVQGLGRSRRVGGLAVAHHEPVHRARGTGPRRWASTASCARAAAASACCSGGLLTSVLSWHWIFLVNLPIGVAGVRAVPSGSLPLGTRPCGRRTARRRPAR